MADEYESNEAKAADLREAEALTRRDESVANIMSRRLGQDEQATRKAAQDAAKAAKKSAQEAEKIAKRAAKRDLSGTAPTMSDTEGNYAPNPEVATTGGTDVEASNSTEGGKEAKSAENVDLSPADAGVTEGDKPVGKGAKK